MPTEYAIAKAAQVWCTEKNKNTQMDVNLAEEFANVLDAELNKMKDVAEFLWIVLANVGNGQGRSWEQESEDWQKAAKKAREDYCAVCSTQQRKTA